MFPLLPSISKLLKHTKPKIILPTQPISKKAFLTLTKPKLKQNLKQRHNGSPDTLFDDDNTQNKPHDEDELYKRTNHAPFSVYRTGADNIPCYVTLRHNQPVTILRKIHGNKEALIRELEMITEKKVVDCGFDIVEIKGDHKKLIKRWLQGNHF